MTNYTLTSVIAVIGGFINIFLGFKLVSKLKKKEKYFKYGIIFVAISLFLIPLSQLSLISTIYGLLLQTK